LNFFFGYLDKEVVIVEKGIITIIFGFWLGGAFTYFSGLGLTSWEWWVFITITILLAKMYGGW
jgi:hypothetical protein